MKFELVFIPHPGMGHIRSTVEVAKLLVERDNRLSITVLVLPFLPGDNVGAPAYVAALSAASNDRFRCQVISGTPEPMKLIKNHIPKVRQAVGKLIDDYSNSPDSPDSPRILAGFVVDMFCTPMVGVAKEFGVPSYLFFASSAALIGLIFAIEKLHEKNEYNVSESEYEDSEAVLDIPSLARPFPVKCLPHGLVSKEILPIFINQAKMFKEMKGILVNTVAELESHALQYLNGGTDTQIPPTYSVGPLIHLQNQVEDVILEWLDDQPAKSVVFLCFGSMGGFSEEQAREIAVALDRSGHRFLWTLRRASPQDMKPSVEFTNLEEVLPDGFFDRTKERGKVIGWAPQVAVLAKPAIGGFITHCGWNSVLESLWFGVPTAAWPLYAEQKFNAFKIVEEHGLAVEIRKYWRRDPSKELVTAEEIETGIMCLMKHETDVRKRVKDMSDKCHVALMDGGSSQIALQKFIEDVVKNLVSA